MNKAIVLNGREVSYELERKRVKNINCVSVRIALYMCLQTPMSPIV